MANVIELRNVNKFYGKNYSVQVLYDLSLAFEEKSFNSIIGQSGSGKSTLLNIMGLLDSPSEGSVFINNRDVSKLNRKSLAQIRNETLGFIFQFHYLLPEYTALENVLLPYRISKKKITPEVLARANELLEFMGLGKVKNNLANNMSGGQQQRVAIARSLINNPTIVLADEPTGNLDSKSTEQIYELLREINQKYKPPLLSSLTIEKSLKKPIGLLK